MPRSTRRPCERRFAILRSGFGDLGVGRERSFTGGIGGGSHHRGGQVMGLQDLRQELKENVATAFGSGAWHLVSSV